MPDVALKRNRLLSSMHIAQCSNAHASDFHALAPHCILLVHCDIARLQLIKLRGSCLFLHVDFTFLKLGNRHAYIHKIKPTPGT